MVFPCYSFAGSIPPFKDSWAIPGGFVLEDESLEASVKRELIEETGVKVNYLEQLYTKTLEQ